MLNDLQIKAWIKNDVRFEGRSDSGGLYLCYRTELANPMWRFRYRLAGRQYQMFIGHYPVMTLAKARVEAKKLKAMVTLGHNPATEKQNLKSIAKNESTRLTVGRLIDDYYHERIVPKYERPEQVLGHLNRLNVHIGKMFVNSVTGEHIHAMYQKDLKRGYPASTNKLREQTLKMFGYAVAKHVITVNPAQWLDISYAGGKSDARDRVLSRDELVTLFGDMRSKSFGRDNYLTVKLLLALCVRKGELIQARKSEFDLDAGTWELPKHRTKTNSGITIPLPKQAIAELRELFALSAGSEYLLPARASQGQETISNATLGKALRKTTKINFAVHDLRRTAKTKLQELGVDEFISERCLNHKVSGVTGTYGRHDFFDQRKKALQLWANYLESLENGKAWNVATIRKAM